MPGAVRKRWSRVFAQLIAGSPVRIVDIALGDNDIEIQRNLLQEMLEREIDVVSERPLRQRRQWVKGVT